MLGRRRLSTTRLLPSHEAHLPAQEAQARPHPRVPRPHAHEGGSGVAEAPPRQGPQAAHPVGMPPRGERGRARRGKRNRLSRSADFDRVYREGRSHASRYLVVYAFPRSSDADEPRLGISVGRKVGGAVERNRMKRLLREAFWATAGDLPDGYDFVLVARPDAGDLGRERGEAGVEAALREVLAKAGLAGGDAS